jgi:hypothetical protein
MKNRRVLLLALFTMILTLSLTLPVPIAGASATMNLPDNHSIIHSTAYSSSLVSGMALNTPAGKVKPMVAVGQ